MKRFLITLYILLLISFGYLVTDIYLPSLPALKNAFHATDHDVQLTLFSYLLSFSFGPLLFGPLSDHIGRKPLLFGGIFLTILASVGCLFSPHIYLLIVFRAFQGFGTGAVLIAARASVSDRFVGDELSKQISVTTMLMPFVLSLAPFIGGILQTHFQWQGIFIFIICYSFLLLMFVLMAKESLKEKSQEKLSTILIKYRPHLRNRLFLLYGLNYILPSFGFFGYMTISPFLFQEILGLTPTEYGSLAFYIGGTILISGYINIKLMKKFSLNQILNFGSLLMILSGGILLSFHFLNILTTWSLLFPILIFFTCLPFCVSNGAAKCMSLVDGNFGAATALLTTFQFLMGALGSYAFSLISDRTTTSLEICLLLMGGLSIINLGVASRLEKKFSAASYGT